MPIAHVLAEGWTRLLELLVVRTRRFLLQLQLGSSFFALYHFLYGNYLVIWLFQCFMIGSRHFLNGFGSLELLKCRIKRLV